MQIDALVPKLAREGRLRAIRRLVPSGEAKYQVLQLTGDGTVEDQVNERYLTAEQEASVMPSNLIASTTKVLLCVDRDTLAFRVTPRTKPIGRIRGAL